MKLAVVVFRSKAGGEIIMMRQHVEPIFQLAGLPFHDKGAVLAEDIPSVILALEKAINQEQNRKYQKMKMKRKKGPQCSHAYR